MKKSDSNHITRIGKRNQVTIPVAMLRKLGLCPGDSVIVRATDGTIRLEGVEAAVNRAYGLLYRPDQPTLTDEELEEEIRVASEEAATARYERSLRDEGPE